MNKAKFEGLPTDVQDAIMRASGAGMSRTSSELVEKSSDERFAKLAEGKTVRSLDEAELAAWQGAFEKATSEWVAANPEAAESLAALKAAMKD